MLTILPLEHAPVRGKRPRHFPCFVVFFYFFFSCSSSSQTMRNMEKILPQYCAAFDGLHSFVHLRVTRDSWQMMLFRSLCTSLLGKMPFAMTIFANCCQARLTTLYSAVCLCCKPLLTQRSRITWMKCVRNTMGQ